MASFDQQEGLRLEDLASGRERRRWHKIPGESYGAFDLLRRTAAPWPRSPGRMARTDFSRNLITLWDTVVPHRVPSPRLDGDWYGFHGLKFSADGKDLIVASDDWNPPQAGGFPLTGRPRSMFRADLRPRHGPRTEAIPDRGWSGPTRSPSLVATGLCWPPRTPTRRSG